MDTPWVRTFDQIKYEKRLGDHFRRLRGCHFPNWLTIRGKVVWLSHSYEEIYFFTDWRNCSPDVYFECHMSSVERKPLPGWQNMDFLPYLSWEKLFYTPDIHQGGKLLNVAA